MSIDKLVRGLGWFSLGLAVAEIVSPNLIGRFLGRSRPGLIRLFGVREAIAGLGLLSRRNPASWLWARVAGDALDLMALAMTLRAHTAKRRNAAFATAAVAGVTALDFFGARKATRGQA